MSLDGWDVDEEHDYNIEINEAWSCTMKLM
jgi:hypothetical protein